MKFQPGLMILFILFLSGCDLFVKEEKTLSPGALFNQLEQQLLNAEHIEISYRLLAEGAVSADLKGTLTVNQGNNVELKSTGTFAGQPFELHLSSDGISMQGGPQKDTNTFEDVVPLGLNEALLIGATRMGLLHNHARLTGGVPPDHPDGTVQTWVQVSNFTDDAIKGIQALDARPVTFELTVDGQSSGEATLWFDSNTGRLLQRNQVVHFDFGDMFVTETYESITIQKN